MQTLNQIVRKLNQLQQGHEQLNSFYFGDPWEIEASGEISYPLFGATIQPGNLSKRVQSTKIIFWFAGLVSKDEHDETEVLSDMQLIAMDIFAQFWEWCDVNQIELIPDAPFSTFTEKWDSEVSGWQMEVTMNQFYSRDTCQVPSTIEPPHEDDGSVLIYDQDGNIIARLHPGQSYQVLVGTGFDEGGVTQTYTIKIIDI